MATPSPTYVEIDCSRASMASTYAGSTAPTSTSTPPQRRIASSRLAACSSSLIASRWRIASSTDIAAVLHGLDDLGDGGIADEQLDRHDHLVGRAHPGPRGQAGVADHHVGIGRDGVDRGVLDDHIVLRQLPLELARQHDAAAHPGVAGDDDLPDRVAVDGCHACHASLGVAARLAGVGCWVSLL